VVELKEGGYNASFAPNLGDLKDRIDIKKLNLSEEEWKPVYENTKLRFGDEKKDCYGFVVAVPRPGVGTINRSGFSLVYWTKNIEFPTVHEQSTKSAAPITVDMDATLIGLNIGIPQNHGSEIKITTTPKNIVRYMINEDWINEKLNTEKLPTEGILNSKPKKIHSSDVNFVSFFNFTGQYLNINIPALFISNEDIKKFTVDVDKVEKLETAYEIIQFQKEMNKNLKIQQQPRVDVLEDDIPDYKYYMGRQMALSSHLVALHSMPVT